MNEQQAERIVMDLQVALAMRSVAKIAPPKGEHKYVIMHAGDAYIDWEWVKRDLVNPPEVAQRELEIEQHYGKL